MARPGRVVLAGAATGLLLVAFGKGMQTGTTPTASIVPESIDIPSIDVDAPLMKLGLSKDGEVELPPYEKPKVAGWYTGSAVPGEKGASVIIGHVDTKTAPAVFYKLRQLRKGETVKVERSDGKVVSFKVDHIEQVHKDSFPTRRVYLEDGLKLVTCGGKFDYAKGEYLDNIIVYASRA
ncbi:class F sortase [Nonomuraea angiospora]|uniref:LPXTG-site transpeptidase (Sortase) family protein n=2 Tax=Nonomuraea TaxID=83681 RepID=A0A7W9G4J6_9ACTN|nr:MULTISPECIES: class F sortase [Nonomuraea]MBB5777076.1 LPXTG-site transpeptidase (sortase) family protein [Nonomuraea jabiensis]MBE1589990.1 LPXTG-site transpeptidase (sortase) family protein [Nonomuraea angiospora]MDX3103753.1 class F sortase [Nonomuraea angiospora]